MATILDDPDRRTVPRWRLWKDAVLLGDVNTARDSRVPKKVNLNGLARAKYDWELHQTLPFAGDFLGLAYSLGQGDLAFDAAEFVRKQSSGASRAVNALAAHTLSKEFEGTEIVFEPHVLKLEERRYKISTLRNALHSFPRNPLVYMDLAREYVVLGQAFAAIKPVRTALNLAPNNRFILRSASRFFLHFNDPEQAHDILRRSECLKFDPWILAAEIAVASVAGRTSRLVKSGRNLVTSKKFSPATVSELASAIGTLEWKAGNVRMVKRLFRRALEKPTENVVAQAGWITRRIGDLGMDPLALKILGAYEARAWANILECNWSESLTAAELWHRDEPFSKRAAVFGSWVALVTVGDYKRAEVLARQGLLMHDKEFLLLNNLAVSLAYMGKISEAAIEFDKIKQEEIDSVYQPIYFATKGLIKFRLGSLEEGRHLYREAVDKAKSRKDIRTAVLAILHFAREEFRHAPNKGEKLVKEAFADYSRFSKFDQAIFSRLLELTPTPEH